MPASECSDELPALDRLQDLLGNEDLEIIALSIDDAGIEKPVSFVRGLGLTKLRVYLDFEEMAFKGFPLYGLPISYLGLLNHYIQDAEPDASG